MGLTFPGLEFFQALQAGLAEDPSRDALAPSEACCGVSVDGRLFVLEFDGHDCVAVAAGGNPIDLEFVLAGSAQGWREVLRGKPLDELLASGALHIESDTDDGADLALAALPLLQAFFAQARSLEVDPG
ncbi:MAG: hypothetical protein ACQGVC_13325 [Myxococcota bacterium]